MIGRKRLLSFLTARCLGIDQDPDCFELDRRLYIRALMEDRRVAPFEGEQMMLPCAKKAGKEMPVVIEQEGGPYSPNWINLIRRSDLRGYAVAEHVVHGHKFDRAGPFASIQEAGNVDLGQAGWNAPFMLQAIRPRPMKGIIRTTMCGTPLRVPTIG